MPSGWSLIPARSSLTTARASLITPVTDAIMRQANRRTRGLDQHEVGVQRALHQTAFFQTVAPTFGFVFLCIYFKPGPMEKPGPVEKPRSRKLKKRIRRMTVVLEANEYEGSL